MSQRWQIYRPHVGPGSKRICVQERHHIPQKCRELRHVLQRDRHQSVHVSTVFNGAHRFCAHVSRRYLPSRRRRLKDGGGGNCPEADRAMFGSKRRRTAEGGAAKAELHGGRVRGDAWIGLFPWDNSKANQLQVLESSVVIPKTGARPVESVAAPGKEPSAARVGQLRRKSGAEQVASEPCHAVLLPRQHVNHLGRAEGAIA